MHLDRYCEWEWQGEQEGTVVTGCTMEGVSTVTVTVGTMEGVSTVTVTVTVVTVNIVTGCTMEGLSTVTFTVTVVTGCTMEGVSFVTVVTVVTGCTMDGVNTGHWTSWHSSGAKSATARLSWLATILGTSVDSGLAGSGPPTGSSTSLNYCVILMLFLNPQI